MPYYAVLDKNGTLVAVWSEIPAIPLPSSLTIRTIGLSSPPSGFIWNTAAQTFIDPRPHVRITADQTTLFEWMPGTNPQPNQLANLTGTLTDWQGNPDPTASFPEMMIRILNPNGLPALVQVQGQNGTLQFNSHGTWISMIPFITEHSGTYDLSQMLSEAFVIISAPIIQVLRG